MRVQLPPPDPKFLTSDDGWPLLARMLGSLALMVVSPAALVLAQVLPVARGKIAAMLRTMEALARRLLLIEAALLPLAPYRPFRASAAAAPPPPQARPRFSEEPANWRVSLAVFPAVIGGAAVAPISPGGVPPRFKSFRTLARRFEALERIAADPARYAKRLAAQLPRQVLRRALEPWPPRRVIDIHLVTPAQIEARRAVHALRPNTS